MVANRMSTADMQKTVDAHRPSGKAKTKKKGADNTDPGKSNPHVQNIPKEGMATGRDNGYPSQTGGKAYGRGATMPVLASDIYANIELPDLGMFNPAEILLDGTVVAVGKRRTGKSWIFRNLMYLMKDKFQSGIVISQTDELNKFWRQYIPAKYIYPKYQPEILQNVFKRQKKILNDSSRTEAEKERDAPFFVLLDDVISDQRLKYDEALMELFVAGRHYKLFVLITTQYAKAITPTLRGNTDYCFLLKCIQQRQLEALWEDFGSFLTKDAFAHILNAYTEDNECLVINTCPDHEVDPVDMMTWWKAVDPGSFAMGSVEYWQNAMRGMDVAKAGSMPQDVGKLLTVERITKDGRITHMENHLSNVL